MSLFDSPEGLEALDEVGVSFEQLGRSLRRLATEGQKARRGRVAADDDEIPQLVEVGRFWSRLGPANRDFLYQAAKAFPPGDVFSLDDLAKELGTTKGSVKARLMNFGRSMRSLGPAAPMLWDVDWDESAGENIYDFDTDAHRAILGIVDGR